jgi:hypothetical protein
MAQVYSKQARKNAKGVFYAPGKSESGYMLFRLCENYDSRAHGGISKTWRYVAKGLSLEEAKAKFEKLLGRKIYADPTLGGPISELYNPIERY